MAWRLNPCKAVGLLHMSIAVTRNSKKAARCAPHEKLKSPSTLPSLVDISAKHNAKASAESITSQENVSSWRFEMERQQKATYESGNANENNSDSESSSSESANQPKASKRWPDRAASRRDH